METKSSSSKIAIIGIGCLFPKAKDLSEYWSNIKNKVDAITDIPPTHWKAEDYFNANPQMPDHTYGKRGGFIPAVNFDTMKYSVTPNTLEAIDTSQLLGLMVAEQTFQDAGYSEKKTFDRSTTSVILGVTGTLEMVIPLGARLGHPLWRKAIKQEGIDEEVAEKIVRNISDGYVGWQENSFPGLLGNVVAGRIANHFDLGGTNCVVDAACASSFSALHMACMELQSGKSNMVLTGGVDTFNDIFMYMCFSKTPALSASGNARPFDQNTDGTILGEGLGMILLKRYEDAKRDGDRIYAVIRSIGTSSDGKGAAVFAPKAEGQVKALKKAYQSEGILPQSIELMEAHGTGTKVGDVIELESLNKVYKSQDEKAFWCALGSVKSQIGHTKAAAGSAGLIKIALALYHKILPPTIKIEKPAQPLTQKDSPFYLNTEKRPWIHQKDHPLRAAVSAFGFGGSNYHCILEEDEPLKKQNDWDNKVQILALSSNTKEEIESKLKSYSSLSWQEIVEKAWKSRLEFSSSHKYRLLIPMEEGISKISETCHDLLSMLQKNPDKASWATPSGAYFGSNGTQGNIGILFPGQGSQYTGMLRDLCCHFPQMYEILEQANYSFECNKSQEISESLLDCIYPKPVFNEEDKKRLEERLRNTAIAQPALGAVSLGALHVLKYFGIQPQSFAGHSYGELVALCAAGCFSQKDLHKLSALRGKLMVSPYGSLGAMLAVQSDIATLSEILKKNSLDLVIANKNAPNQVVLSGLSIEIQKAQEILSAQKIQSTVLPVSAAFHSSLVAKAQEPFGQALEQISVASPSLPVFSNTTAGQYPKEPQEIKAILASQLAMPVEFVEEIRAMYKMGIRTFVEIGPGKRLTGLVNAILKEHSDVTTIAIDESSGKKNGIFDLAKVLSCLASLGHSIQLPLWAPDSSSARPVENKPRMMVSLCGANYVNPKKKEAQSKAPVQEKKAEVIQKAIPETKIALPQKGEMTKMPEKNTQEQIPRTQMPEPAPEKKSVQHQTQAISNIAHPSIMEALKLSQQNLQILQKMQEQTAELHKQFLSGQDIALQSFYSLVQQQQMILGGIPASRPPIQTSLPESTVIAQNAVVPKAVQNFGMTLENKKVIETHFSDVPQQKEMPRKAQDILPDWKSKAKEEKNSDSSENKSNISQILISIIAQKTGYPEEMLTMDMSLNNDLGIDSIKRVEIFSSLKEKLPQAQAIQTEHIGRLKTLRDIVDFLAPVSDKENAVEKQEPSSSSQEIASILIEIIAAKTGYPAEMLTMDMSLNNDLGIDSIKRVEIFSSLKEKLPQAQAIQTEHIGKLKTLRDIVDFLAPVSDIQQFQHQQSGAFSSSQEIANVLIEIMAAKTGYPAEMLTMDMSLNNDLGIDSIKRVEIFSSLKEKLPQAQAIQTEHIGKLKTLKDIVDFLAPVSGMAKAPEKSQEASSSQEIERILIQVMAEKTGYPAEMLTMDMSLNNDLGIDSIKRVEIFSSLKEKLPQAQAIQTEHIGKLKTLKDITDFLTSPHKAIPEPKAMPVAEKKQEPAHRPELERKTLSLEKISLEGRKPIRLKSGSCIGIAGERSALTESISQNLKASGYTTFLLSLEEPREIPTELSGLMIVSGTKTDNVFLKNSLCLLQKAYPLLKQSSLQNEAVFMTISFLDGCFGMGNLHHEQVLSGGLSGLAKTAQHEYPWIHSKALDVAPDFISSPQASKEIVEEFLTSGPIEVGLTGTSRVTIKLSPSSIAPEKWNFSTKEVIVVTGGARGVTARCAIKLAESISPSPVLILMGRSPIPDAEVENLANLSEEAAIKRELMAQEKKISPRELEAKYKAFMAAREIRQTLSTIESKGCKAEYYSLDVRDKDAVKATIAEVHRKWGEVTGLVHGAGVIADQLIEKKSMDSFDLVYDTKVIGIHNLLESLEKDNLKFFVLFSSSTARFGRTGQVDYAMANEILNKIAQRQSRLRPSCRVVSVNWGPWEGGMVTPSLAQIFEKEGVGLIPMETGADHLWQEICSRDSSIEVVVLGSLNGKNKPVQNQESAYTLAFEREMDITRHPFLRAHILDSKAVLPVAIIVEWLSHGAMHLNPGFSFYGFENLSILKGLKIPKDQAPLLQVLTQKAEKRDGLCIVPAILRSTWDKNNFDLNARANIVLGSPRTQETKNLSAIKKAYPHTPKEMYEKFLFHGEIFQGIEKVQGVSQEGISASVRAAGNPSEWMQDPLRNRWISDPLILDCAFQMMILWSFDTYGCASLPSSIGKFQQMRKFSKDNIQIHAHVKKHSESTAISDIEFVDSKGVVALMEDYECTLHGSLKNAFELNYIV